MKKNKTLLKELFRELHYWQMLGRIEMRWARKSADKCKEIAKMMRRLQTHQ